MKLLKNREHLGWYFYDWANSAFYTTVATVFLGPYLTSIAKNAANSAGDIDVFGFDVYHGSFFPYIVSASVLFQILVLPLAGALTDYSKRKKLLLGLFALIGSIATMSMYFLDGSKYLLGGSLFIIANVSFGASIVVYNSFLNDISTPDERDSVSSKGWAFGYLGGGLLLAINLLLFTQADNFGLSSGEAIRISLFSSGLWWAIFTVLPMTLIKSKAHLNPAINFKHMFSISFNQFKSTLNDAKKQKVALVFLIAFLIYNDGVQTVIVVASQFGQEALGISMDVLTMVILGVQFVAIFGSLFFGWLAKLIGAKNAITLSLIIWIISLVYAFAVLNSQTEFIALAGFFALVLGGTQALSRSYFSRLIPEGKEAEYFSFYEISDKGTSWIGPLLFGLSLQLTQSYKWAILSLVTFFIIGLIILLKIKD